MREHTRGAKHNLSTAYLIYRISNWTCDEILDFDAVVIDHLHPLHATQKKWKYPRKKDEVTVDVSQLLDLKLQMSGISVAGTQCSGYWISMILMLKSSRETYSPRITENSSDVNYFWDMQYSNQSYERMSF